MVKKRGRVVQVNMVKVMVMVVVVVVVVGGGGSSGQACVIENVDNKCTSFDV